MSQKDNELLNKKIAKLKGLEARLNTNKNTEKKKREGFDQKIYNKLSKKKGSLSNNEKSSLDALTITKKQLDEFQGIFDKYNKDIAKLKREIAALKKAGAKASTTKKADTEKTSNKKVAAATTTCKTNCNNKVTPKPLPGGKICITIDHFGFAYTKTSLDIVKELRKEKIPVTVFVQCTAGEQKLMKFKAKITSKKLSRQKIPTFTPTDLTTIRAMKALGAKIGIHLLGSRDVKGLTIESATQKQIDNIEYMKSVPEVGKVRVASYHGDNIETVAGLQNTIVQNSFDCIRGTANTPPKGLKKYTPVSYSLGDINKKSVTYFFFHSHQTIGNNLYKNLLEGVRSGKYKAVPYYC